MLSAQFFLDFNTNIIKSLFPVFCNIGLVSWLILTLSLLKVIKVNVLPSNFTHRYEVRKGKHGFLYFAQTIADAAISSHNITHTFSIWMVWRICILILRLKGLNYKREEAYRINIRQKLSAINFFWYILCWSP